MQVTHQQTAKIIIFDSSIRCDPGNKERQRRYKALPLDHAPRVVFLFKQESFSESITVQQEDAGG